MRYSDYKYIYGIALILITGAMHIVFFENNDKYDVYMFYNHKRYLTNILYDISVLTEFTVLTGFAIKLNRKIWRPMFYFSLMQWVAYFMVYRQMWTLAALPILILLYYYEFRARKT